MAEKLPDWLPDLPELPELPSSGSEFILSVFDYFTDKAVRNIFGRKKVRLYLADDERIATGEFFEFDATENLAVSINNKSAVYSAESHSVYTDGIVNQPNVMELTAQIQHHDLPMLQKYAKPDKWMYVSHYKEMGGTIRSINIQSLPVLYTISDLKINDIGFKNSVTVSVTLTEVRVYKYGLDYKYGYRQTKPGSGGDGSASAVKGEKQEEFKYESFYK